MSVILDIVQQHSYTILLGMLIVILYHYSTRSTAKDQLPLPPVVPHSIPFLGHAIQFGISPVEFLQSCKEKYGDCFTFLMLGREMTFTLNPDGNHFLFNVPLANASAEGAYAKLTVPVFGSEVVYDVENAVFMEQKKFVKDAFTVSAFKKYVAIIRQETLDFLSEFKDSSTVQKRGSFKYYSTILFDSMSELTIRTASACLMGSEIRSQLHSNVAQLYHDLDAGLAPMNVFFKWLPLPVYWRRDRAHNVMTDTFKSIIQKRRAEDAGDNKQSRVERTDVLQTLMEATYKNGIKVIFNSL
jgi:sterol 14alpha-demethylase